MEATLHNPDTRPLPAGCTAHFNPQRRMWYYVHLESIPPRVTFIHPDDDDPPTPPSSSSSPQPVPVPAGLSTTRRRRPLTTSALLSNNTSSIQTRQSSQLSKAQLLYASASDMSSPPTTGSEDAQRSLYRTDQSTMEFDPASLYNSPISVSPTSGSSLSSAPLSPNRPHFFQESFSRPQRQVGHSSSFTAGYPFPSTGTHIRSESATDNFRTRTLFQPAPQRNPSPASNPAWTIDSSIRRNKTESALDTMPFSNSNAANFSNPGGNGVYGLTGQHSAPTHATNRLSQASLPTPLRAPMTAPAAQSSQNFYMPGVSAPGPVFVVPHGAAMPQLPGLAQAPAPGQRPQMGSSKTGAPLSQPMLPSPPSHSGSISPQLMAPQPPSQGLSLPPGAAAPQMVPSNMAMAMAQAQQYNYLPNGPMLAPPAVSSPSFQVAATGQMQGVPMQQFAPNPQQQQQEEAKKKQQKILKKVGISFGKSVLKVGAKVALGGIGVDEDVANAAVNAAAFGIEKAVTVTAEANKQEQQQRAMLLAAQQQQLQAAGWQLPPGAGVPQMAGSGPMFVGQARPQY